MHEGGNQGTLVSMTAWAVPSLRAIPGQLYRLYTALRSPTQGGDMELLTRSLTRGMGFRFLMSGMLSMMIRPPPGLQDTGTLRAQTCAPALHPSLEVQAGSLNSPWAGDSTPALAPGLGV